MLLIFIIGSLIYIIYFSKIQVLKLLVDSSTYNGELVELFKVIFMIFKPLGIVSGVLGLTSGVANGMNIKNISSFGCFMQFALTVFTIINAAMTDSPDSVSGVVITVIVLSFITLVWNLIGMVAFLFGKIFSKTCSKST